MTLGRPRRIYYVREPTFELGFHYWASRPLVSQHSTPKSADTVSLTHRTDNKKSKIVRTEQLRPGAPREKQRHNSGSMNSLVVKRSIVFNGNKTSISLEEAFWQQLKSYARSHQVTIAEVVCDIDATRQGNLSSAIRLFVLDSLCSRLSRFLAQSAEPDAMFEEESLLRSRA
jgi:predicted DNA-binding ribbon-helix-helix protein